MKKTIGIYILVIAVIAGCLTILFFSLFEKAQIEIHTPASEQARRNPFLAAQKFLIASGIDTKSVNRKDILVDLPATNDLIFINQLSANMPKEREDRLIAWMENGGTIMITHNRIWKEKYKKSGNRFLDRFDVRLRYASDLNSDSENEDFQSDDDDNDTDLTDDASQNESTQPDQEKTEGKDSKDDPFTFDDFLGVMPKETVRVDFKDNEFAEIKFDADLVLQDGSDQASQVYSGPNGPHIMTFDVGQGVLIVLSDNDFLRNTHIGDKDHAFYLFKMARKHAKVWLLYSSIMPSFLTVFVKSAPEFIICLVLLMIAVFMMLTTRIGPVYRLRDYTRRNIMEHLLAAGHFIRKHDPQKSQIDELRSTILKNIAAKHLYFDLKSKDQQFKLISKWTRFPLKDIYAAFSTQVKTTGDYISVTKQLQKINMQIFSTTDKRR